MEHLFKLLLCLYFMFCFTGADRFQNVTAALGDSCTLPCFTFRSVSTIEDGVLEWTQLERHKDLLVFRAGRVQDGYESAEFTGRVELLNPQLHSGDLSVVLKDVTFEDSGTYECLFAWEDEPEISQFIHLTVIERGQETTNTLTDILREFRGLFCGLGIGLCVLIIILLSVIRCVRKREESGKSLPSDSEKCPEKCSEKFSEKCPEKCPEKCSEMLKNANPPFKIITASPWCNDCCDQPSPTSEGSDAALMSHSPSSSSEMSDECSSDSPPSSPTSEGSGSSTTELLHGWDKR